MSLEEISVNDLENIKNEINIVLESLGMECYIFLVGWYNTKVRKVFQLMYNENNVAFTIISKPAMFEKAFIPFLKSENANNTQDPLDQCMKKCFNKIKSFLHKYDVEIIHDFELTASRRPKILMQTAGHISGAARFYQRSDFGGEDPWGKDKNIFGVSIHPEYGGWFAFRAVIILNNVECKHLEQKETEVILKKKEDLITLLTLFNENWKDGRYRDIIPVKEKYSQLQIKYFSTLPKDRHQLVQDLGNNSELN